MVLDDMKDRDVLVGLDDKEVRDELLDALEPLVELLRRSEVFRTAIKLEIEAAVSGEGDSGDNFINAIVDDVVTMEYERQGDELDRILDSIPDFDGRTVYGPSLCQNCGQSACMCFLKQPRLTASGTFIIDTNKRSDIGAVYCYSSKTT